MLIGKGNVRSDIEWTEASRRWVKDVRSSDIGGLVLENVKFTEARM